MLEHQHCFSTKRMARVLRVSRSGYYHWCHYGQVPSTRMLNRDSRDMKIKQIFSDSKERYGAIRIQRELIDDQEAAAIKTISDTDESPVIFKSTKLKQLI